MSSTVLDLSGIDLARVRRAVGGTSFGRGESYARQGRVSELEWDEEELTLTATVAGHEDSYETIAFFDEDGRGRLLFYDGECSCPVGHDCKHVAALVITAAGAARQARAPGRALAPPRPTAAGAGPAPAAGPAPWERSLRALAATPSAPATGTPLAIELSLSPSAYSAAGPPRLMARPMRPGARGGWINGSLSWGALDAWSVRGGDYREDHLALLRELYSVHRLSESRGGYYFHPSGGDRSIELSACESPQLWALLDQAAQLGLPLIHAKASFGELPPVERGEIVLDVIRAGGGMQVSPRLQLDGRTAEHLLPVRLVGRTGHGAVCAQREDVLDGLPLERARLALVRLTRPVPAQLEAMLLAGEQVIIPEADVPRFAEDLCLALGRVVSLTSSDGSFAPPTVSEPSLVLHVRHHQDAWSDLAWEFEYEVGGLPRRVPSSPAGAAGFRDPAAERRLLFGSSLDVPALQAVGLLDDERRPVAGPPRVVQGLELLDLCEQGLPAVAGEPGVRLAVSGTPPDFRDVGESLQISVSTTELAGEHDWFDLGVTIAVAGRELPFAEVFTALALGQARMLLDDGAHFSLEDARLEQLRGLIEEARALVDAPPGGPLRISRYQADLWSELVALGVVGEQAERWQRAVAPLLELDTLPEHDLPAGLRAELRPYQREGFSWLASLWDLRLGGILADDMGLGKTVQALALICHARQRDPGGGPFLVVAPTSVAPNWAAEAAQFAPELRVEVLQDTLARSGRSLEQVSDCDVVVTTYTLFRLEFEHHRRIAWAALILDEAQYVKNHRAKTYRCARELDAPFKLAITGTPMENNLMELWAMLSLTAPGLFPDPVRFGEQYARPIERAGDGERLTRLRRRIKPLVKRRSKELVAAELPAKQEQTLLVDLHPRHRKLYDTHLQRERAKVLALLEDFQRNRFTILTSITRLRQLSLHPGLVDECHRSVPSAKLSALTEQLEEVISGGHRALVFSQFTQFLASVRQRLDEERIEYCYLDGHTRRRQAVLERFRTGQAPVFLISLKAGGSGLNLVEADYCFLLDPWWNPATEAQAIDRIHRIGQTRPVNAYRLIARGTIEEKVRALAERKATLFSGVMDEGDMFARGLTAEDIRGLLG